MRYVLGLLLLVAVGCGSDTPDRQARIPEVKDAARDDHAESPAGRKSIDQQRAAAAWHTRIPEDDGAEYFNTSSFRGQKQFSREVAFEILLKTTSFSADGVGPIGVEILPQVYAFQIIAKRNDVPAAFLDLLNRAQPAGQAYALCGLYLVDRPTFDRGVAAYRSSPATLTEESGCTGREVSLGEIVANRSPAAIRLARGQRLDKWFDAHPDGGALDIVGGSYPAALMELQ